MSLFGYPATIVHVQASKDDWGRPIMLPPVVRDAKVIEEQKRIRTANGEEVTISYEVHIEGDVAVSLDDQINYKYQTTEQISFRVRHFEKKKFLGTDDVKKVIVYG